MALSQEQMNLARTDPKTFLSQVQYTKLRVHTRLESIRSWQNLADLAPDKKPVNAVISEVQNEIDALILLQKDIHQLLEDTVKDELSLEILRSRFVQGETLAQVSARTGYTRRWFGYLQTRAIKSFQNNLPAE